MKISDISESADKDHEEYKALRLAERTKKEWGKIAGEEIEVEVIKGVIYVFGSELACLRLEHKFKVGRAAFSENRKTWYYVNKN